MIGRFLIWAAIVAVASACWCCSGCTSCGCGGGGGGGWGYVQPQIIGYNRYPIYVRAQAEPAVREKVVTVVRDEPAAPRVIQRIIHHHHEQPAPQYQYVQPPAHSDSYSVGPVNYQPLQSSQVQSQPYQVLQSPQAPVQNYQVPAQNYQVPQSQAVMSNSYDSGVVNQQLTASQEFSPSIRGFLLRKVKL